MKDKDNAANGGNVAKGRAYHPERLCASGGPSRPLKMQIKGTNSRPMDHEEIWGCFAATQGLTSRKRISRKTAMSLIGRDPEARVWCQRHAAGAFFAEFMGKEQSGVVFIRQETFHDSQSAEAWSDRNELWLSVDVRPRSWLSLEYSDGETVSLDSPWYARFSTDDRKTRQLFREMLVNPDCKVTFHRLVPTSRPYEAWLQRQFGK